MVKKKRNRDKEKHRPTKQRFALQADLYYRDEVAPCAKAYRQAMKARRYEEAATTFAQLETLRQTYRILQARKKKVRIK